MFLNNPGQKKIVQASVPWKDLKFDLLLLVVPLLSMIVSLVYDLKQGHHDYFQRSGAVMVMVAGLLAFRSLKRHWLKAERSVDEGRWARTSKKQVRIDLCTLGLLTFGAIVWGYGDKIYELLFCGVPASP